MPLALGQTEESRLIHNPVIDPVCFALWKLRDEAA